MSATGYQNGHEGRMSTSQSRSFAWRRAAWRLYPVKLRDMQPLVEDWPHQATNEEERLGFWLKRFPDCNWGMVTGPESGTFVLDMGGDKGLKALGDLQRRGRVLPATLITRAGRGKDAFLRWPATWGTGVSSSTRRQKQSSVGARW